MHEKLAKSKLYTIFWHPFAFFHRFFVIFLSYMAPRRLTFLGQTRNFISKICFSMARPPKVPGKADNWQICLFCEKAPRFFHRFLLFFCLEWHLGSWKFQGKPEILFQKYVSVWPDPRKCQGRQIIGKSVFFCGTVLTLGRHFLDSNSTYEAENFTVYSKFNSKNSFYYDRTPKNAWGSQKWQISSNHPDLASHSQALLPKSFKLKTLEQNALKQT